MLPVSAACREADRLEAQQERQKALRNLENWELPDTTIKEALAGGEQAASRRREAPRAPRPMPLRCNVLSLLGRPCTCVQACWA